MSAGYSRDVDGACMCVPDGAAAVVDEAAYASAQWISGTLGGEAWWDAVEYPCSWVSRFPTVAMSEWVDRELTLAELFFWALTMSVSTLSRACISCEAAARAVWRGGC